MLLKLVLNFVPIFYLSFFKVPSKIIKRVVRIQKEFLWGGLRGASKICWVK